MHHPLSHELGSHCSECLGSFDVPTQLKNPKYILIGAAIAAAFLFLKKKSIKKSNPHYTALITLSGPSGIKKYKMPAIEAESLSEAQNIFTNVLYRVVRKHPGHTTERFKVERV